ncbi:hypothetical protein OF829_08185 [Sphingomonas sp. LB-2]|uniref:hypothetical protein n=1 Tax=Sphingomonas caeni TaxID=2984949 RepID=UPI0022303B9D|nr:hypothetical protein [Sphingomonas caeni]MCW3847217.1 hypothetical protein [Sphingomonas caeni]
MDNQTAVDSFLGMGAFFDAAAKANLGVVIVGGLLGGLLQPIVAKLNPRSESPSLGAYWQSPLLGVAAAGITIYVLAHTDTNAAMPTLFFSLLCGLAFPAVLTSAVDNVGKRTDNVQREIAEIASNAKADGIEETVKAARNLRTVLSQNPPGSMKPEAQTVIEASAEQALNNIAQTPAETATLQRQVIEELKDVGAVALSAGWEKTAQAAAEQLKKLSETVDDKTAKAAAEHGAERLSEGGVG